MNNEKRHSEPVLLLAFSENADRFIVVPVALSAHCGFRCTIVDTFEGKAIYGASWESTMCEYFEEEEAEMICWALNKYSH